jgi:hypothetical protein
MQKMANLVDDTVVTPAVGDRQHSSSAVKRLRVVGQNFIPFMLDIPGINSKMLI